jgi:hypothetical protein
MNSWEFYRIIEDRVYGICDLNAFREHLVHLNVPGHVIAWLCVNIKPE